jgi:hypothetical protein
MSSQVMTRPDRLGVGQLGGKRAARLSSPRNQTEKDWASCFRVYVKRHLQGAQPWRMGPSSGKFRHANKFVSSCSAWLEKG